MKSLLDFEFRKTGIVQILNEAQLEGLGFSVYVVFCLNDRLIFSGVKMATGSKATKALVTLGFRALSSSTRSGGVSPSLLRLQSGFSGGDSSVIKALGSFSQVRGFRSGRDDPSFRYEMSPPTNWGVRIVPEKSAFVIERFGKYLKTLGSGLFIISHKPFVFLNRDC